MAGLFFFLSPAAAQAATYYVDAEDGDDSNSGLSEGDAWQTLYKINDGDFLLPGDIVLLKRNQTFSDSYISPKSSGALGNPITIDVYGNGNNPTFNTLYLSNSSFITIRNMNFSGGSYGVQITGSAGNIIKNITLQNLQVVGGGLFDAIYSQINTENLTLEDITITSSDGHGIYLNGTSTNLTIKNIDMSFVATSGYAGINSRKPIINGLLSNIIIHNRRGLDLLGVKDTIIENIETSSRQFGIRSSDSDNVTIKNSTTTNHSSENITVDGQNINIENVFSGNGTYGLRVSGEGSTVNITNSTFLNNGFQAIVASGNPNITLSIASSTFESSNQPIVSISADSSLSLFNSRIKHSGSTVIENINRGATLNLSGNVIEHYGTGNTIFISGSFEKTTNNITHNTIIKHSSSNAVIGINQLSDVTVINNIIQSSSTGIRLNPDFYDGTITESHNLIDTATASVDFILSSSTITTLDPLLNPDFSLQSGSPAIDAGLVLAGHTSDFLGNPILGLPDIGAFEWQGEEESGGSGGGNGSFVIKQSIYNEIALSIGSSLTLSPSLPGVTGGVSSGELPFNIKTNNPLGYQVDLKFSEAVPFRHLFSPSFYILNYVPQVVGVPDYNLVTPSKSHGFAYSVFSDNATQLFRHSGSTCNTGSSNTLGKCWFNRVDASVPTTIIERSGATGAEGATSTLQFRVVVDENATPMLLEGEYQATVTVTVLPL